MRQKVEGGMLARLIEIHAELLGALKALEDLTLSEAPDIEALALARWRRSRANADRARLLEVEIYPFLLDRLPAAEVEPIRKLQADSVAFQNASTAHVASWPIDKAVAEWEDYARAATTMRSARRRRIESERAILYPLLKGSGENLEFRGLSKRAA